MSKNSRLQLDTLNSATTPEMLDGDEDVVIRWLHRSALALGGKTPISLLDISAGCDQVLEHIRRLRYGMIS